MTVKPSSISYGDPVTRWAEDALLAGRAESTIHEYVTRVASFLRHADTPIPELTADHVRRYLLHIRPTIGQSTLYHAAVVLRMFCSWLNSSGITSIAISDLPHISAPNPASAHRLRVTDAEAHLLIDFLRERYRKRRTLWRLRSLAVVALLFGAGLRVGEAAGLMIEDVDTVKREVRLLHTKGGKHRTVPLSASVAGILRLYIYERRRYPGESLLISERRRACSAHTLAQLLKREAAMIGLDISSHTGRRYCITRLAYANLYVAMQVAGHSRLDTTQLYLAPDPDAVRVCVRSNDPLA